MKNIFHAAHKVPSNTAQLDASMRSVPPLARSAEGASARTATTIIITVSVHSASTTPTAWCASTSQGHRDLDCSRFYGHGFRRRVRECFYSL